METLIRPLNQFIERVNGPFSCPAPLTRPSCIYFLSLSWPRMHRWWCADPPSCQNIFTDITSCSYLVVLPQKEVENKCTTVLSHQQKSPCFPSFHLLKLIWRSRAQEVSRGGRWRDFSSVNEQLKRTTWRVFLPKSCWTEIADIC